MRPQRPRLLLPVVPVPVGTDEKHGEKLKKTRRTLRKIKKNTVKTRRKHGVQLPQFNGKTLKLFACRIESHHHVKC